MPITLLTFGIVSAVFFAVLTYFASSAVVFKTVEGQIISSSLEQFNSKYGDRFIEIKYQYTVSNVTRLGIHRIILPSKFYSFEMKAGVEAYFDK